MDPTGVAPEFENLSRRAQLVKMRRVAVDAVADYPIRPRRLRLVHHGHNTTFRVDADDGRSFALRVNLNSRSSVATLAAETAWLTALTNETDLVVPVPQTTIDGLHHTSRPVDALGRTVSVVMMSWLAGRHRHPLTPNAVRELGRVMATMHDHASSWTPPDGAEFPRHESVLVDDPNRIQADHPLLDAETRTVVDDAFERAQHHFDALHETSPSHALHADLHSGNLKWTGRRAAVFDFDDAVVGPPLLDLGISTYYLPPDPRLHAALLEGYAARRSLPRFDDAEFHAVLAARNLLLLNDVIANVNADIRAIRERYVDNTVVKLRAYLDTGTYRHDVPGVVPLGF